MSIGAGSLTDHTIYQRNLDKQQQFKATPVSHSEQ